MTARVHVSRIFLSYSHADQAFVERLHHRLTRDGVDCFFDKKSIAWGDNWVIALERAVKEAERVVLVLTPEYCQSEWARLERTSAMADDPPGSTRRLLPLLLKPCDPPQFLKAVQYIDVAGDAKFEEEYSRICEMKLPSK